jgi:CheY-like chemotaxis protein
VILLDLNMPGMNGWDFLARFERSFPLLEKPVDIYICSSSVDRDEQALALSYPFVRGFFQKPIKAETLVSLYAYYEPAKRLAS